MANGFDYNASPQIKDNDLFVPRRARAFLDIRSLQSYQLNYDKKQEFNHPSMNFKKESPSLLASKENKTTFSALTIL